MSNKCKCGALPLSDGTLSCGTTRDAEMRVAYSRTCIDRQARQVTVMVENLAEFHRGVSTCYHRWSTGEIDALEYVDETAKLLIVLPAEDVT